MIYVHSKGLNSFFTARRIICNALHSVVYAVNGVCPSVRHKPVFYGNGWINKAGFRHTGYHWLILHYVTKEFGYKYLEKIWVLPSVNLYKLRVLADFSFSVTTGKLYRTKQDFTCTTLYLFASTTLDLIRIDHFIWEIFVCKLLPQISVSRKMFKGLTLFSTLCSVHAVVRCVSEGCTKKTRPCFN